MGLIVKEWMLMKGVYFNIKAVEVDIPLKKMDIRFGIYNKDKSIKTEYSHEVRVDRYVIINSCYAEALKLVNQDSLEKAVRKKIKTENSQLNKEGLPRITAEEAKKRIKRAVETEATGLMKDIGETKFDNIFGSDLLNTPVLKVAYNYIKTYIDEFKKAKDA